MKFTDKLLPFSIDNILESTHLSFPTINKHTCSNGRLENFSDHRFLSCHSNFIHHRRCRRTRTVFSDAQLIGLEKRFETQKYLSTPDRIELAHLLHLSQLQVKTWYQNRRMKWKKQVLQDGYKQIPTKPKGRPKKNSIPSYAELQRLENEKQIISSSYTSDDEYTHYSENEDELIDIEQ